VSARDDEKEGNETRSKKEKEKWGEDDQQLAGKKDRERIKGTERKKTKREIQEGGKL